MRKTRWCLRARRFGSRADELVEEMSDLLARSPRFAFEAEETFDDEQ